MAMDTVTGVQEPMRLIIDTIPAMVWRMRTDGNLDFVNRRWLDYTGLSFAEAAEDPTGIIHPHDRPGAVAKWKIDMANGASFEDEMRLRRADGNYRWFLVRTVPLRDVHGNIVCWYGTSTDIEDRKQMEEKLTRSETQLSEAQRVARVGSWNWDAATKETTWSDELYRIFAVPPDTPNLREDALRVVHEDDRDVLRRTLEHAQRTKQEYELDYRIRRSDGEVRLLHTHGNVATDESGALTRLFGAIQDVTELRRAEEELRARTEQLRALSGRLQSAREEEGARIAREIHDELGSSLTSLRWELEGVKKIIEGDAVRSCVTLTVKLTDMLVLTDTMIANVRRIASGLRPAVLDVLGLEEAIEWQAEQFQQRTGIAVRCESRGRDLRLNSVQATAVFRIFQEALTNILRHARATKVDVVIMENAGVFVLIVSDDGRGITKDERVGELSIGLVGMRERAHLMGGEIDVSGVDGEGTTVTLRLPIST
jgi:PAS domain S-box-containing protein